MLDPIAAASADLTDAKNRMVRAFNKTPDDRLNWSPSETSRSALQIVAHSAFSLGFVTDMLNGSPYPIPTTEEADRGFLEMDKGISSREEALALLETNYGRYAAFLAGCRPGDLEKMIKLPFGLGEAPLSFVIAAGAMHTRGHLGQLEYLQTIYGDRSW